MRANCAVYRSITLCAGMLRRSQSTRSGEGNSQMERTPRSEAETGGKGLALYTRLRDDVLAGVFQPGERLSESELGRQYGASRTPTREAVARLEHEGLVVRQGLIARIRERRPEEIVDLYRIRVFMEKAIAMDAAQRRRELDLVALERAIAAEAEVDRADSAAVQEANRRVHSALAAAAHNEPLLDLQQRLTLQVAAIPGTTLAEPGRWEAAHAEHQQILAAVRDQDAEAAGAVAEAHMNKARELRLAMLASTR